MSKTFTYTRQCSPSYYSESTDEDFYDEEDFEYEVEWDDVRDALSEIMYQEYFLNVIKVIPGIQDDKELKKKICNEIQKSINNMISGCDLEDSLSELCEDELKDYFEQDAMDCWNNN